MTTIRVTDRLGPGDGGAHCPRYCPLADREWS
jgi:hypothetical protein